jgi:hypothetical protein
MTDSSTPGGVLDRLAAAPSRTAGVVAAALALALMLIGAVLIPSIVTEETDQVTLVRWFLGGNVLAFLGFLPLLHAVHALIGSRAVPPWSMAVAYALLLIRPLALVPEMIAAPVSVLSNLGLGPQVPPYLLLATTGIAAAFAAWAVLPLAQEAVSSGRRWAVAVGVGVLVALALFSFAPFIAPLATLGVGVALLMRRGSSGGHDPSNGPAGQN